MYVLIFCPNKHGLYYYFITEQEFQVLTLKKKMKNDG